MVSLTESTHVTAVREMIEVVSDSDVDDNLPPGQPDGGLPPGQILPPNLPGQILPPNPPGQLVSPNLTIPPNQETATDPYSALNNGNPAPLILNNVKIVRSEEEKPPKTGDPADMNIFFKLVISGAILVLCFTGKRRKSAVKL